MRDIFAIYLERESLIETATMVNGRGWTMKRWLTQEGNPYGGSPFTKNSLFRLLTNPVYTGQVRYKGDLYPGEHEAIVDREAFEHVQRLMKRNGRNGSPMTRNKFGALLRGILRCGPCECGMVHSFTTRKNKRYRYYQCANAQARGWAACPAPSVPAIEIENFVVDQLRKAACDKNLMLDTLQTGRIQCEEALGRLDNERCLIEREMRRHHDALNKAATKASSADPEWIADLNDRIRMGEQRAIKIGEEVEALSRKMLSYEEVAQSCNNFDDLWDTLTIREQVRMVNLLVRQVRYDGPKGTVSITFHETGIKTLSNEEEKS